jgi:CSLREA domain-containing protein
LNALVDSVSIPVKPLSADAGQLAIRRVDSLREASMAHIGAGLCAAIARAARVSLALGLSICAIAGAAHAATFVVTTSTDSNDGACTVALCSLRDAVIASNATAGPNIITLPAGTYTLTISGTAENAAATGDLDIRNNGVTINGAGSATTIIDGGGIDRVFDVSTAPVIINGVTIQNGLPESGANGGGIANDGTLTLNNCIVTGNHTSAGGAGAGIWTNNTLTLNNTTVSGNVAGGGGNGGGIYNGDQVTINASTISGNFAGPAGGNGGGIYNSGLMSITDTTISGNTGTGGGDGAGLYENSNGNAISRSTFSGNTTNGSGGGIFVNGQPLTLTNVTISGNTAGSGGGLFNNGNALHIVASTIANNTGGGITNNGSADATGTIIANNGTNCSSAITDSGTNLQFPGTTCGLSIPSADPLLQPLANNGGPTQTHALVAGSPAVDANTEICPPTPPTDQRGVSRPQGLHCDIGAFELAAVGGLPTLSINNVSQNEGNSGTTPFVFTVTLSAASASTVTVNYATADGTATAPSDYAATSGTLTFAPGVTTQTITVNVVGDTTPEPNETFTVNLSTPANATIAAGTGTGTIVDDDAAPPPPPATNIPTLSEWALFALAAMLFISAAMSLRRRRR